MAGIDLSQPDQKLIAGGGLEEEGIAGVTRANQGLAAAAQSQSERMMYNARKAGGGAVRGALGGAASGAAVGAMVGGPWGAVIGGVVGGLAGGLMSK
jgi:hypothetical protein